MRRGGEASEQDSNTSFYIRHDKEEDEAAEESFEEEVDLYRKETVIPSPVNPKSRDNSANERRPSHKQFLFPPDVKVENRSQKGAESGGSSDFEDEF